jgi:hypothetical protein
MIFLSISPFHVLPLSTPFSSTFFDTKRKKNKFFYDESLKEKRNFVVTTSPKVTHSFVQIHRHLKFSVTFPVLHSIPNVAIFLLQKKVFFCRWKSEKRTFYYFYEMIIVDFYNGGRVAQLLAENHLAESHLSENHLANRPLANSHLANRHFTDNHFAGTRLADMHLTDTIGLTDNWSTDNWSTSNWLTDILTRVIL